MNAGASHADHRELMPLDEALAMLTMMREILVRDYAGAMVQIVDEAAYIARNGHAERQAGYALNYTSSATTCGSGLCGRVYDLLADLLWEVVPANLEGK